MQPRGAGPARERELLGTRARNCPVNRDRVDDIHPLLCRVVGVHDLALEIPLRSYDDELLGVDAQAHLRLSEGRSVGRGAGWIILLMLIVVSVCM